MTQGKTNTCQRLLNLLSTVADREEVFHALLKLVRETGLVGPEAYRVGEVDLRAAWHDECERELTRRERLAHEHGMSILDTDFRVVELVRLWHGKRGDR